MRRSQYLLRRPDGSCCSLWLERPAGFLGRLLGLIGRLPLGAAQGLWLAPCRAVHTFAMRQAIDLLFVDRQQRVVDVVSALVPWRVAICRRAISVVELRAGEASRLRIDPGAVLVPLGTPACVNDRPIPGHPSLQEETAMARQTEGPDTPRPRGRRARTVAAAAAVSLVSGCATTGTLVESAGPPDMPPMRQFAPLPAGVPLAESGATAESVSEAGIEAQSTDGASFTDTASSTSSPSSTEAASATDSAPSTHAALLSPDRLADGEILYRNGRFDEALSAFRAIAEADPSNAHAWLRVGNVLHRKREWFDALSAYRKAARPQADPVIREKAVYNVALLNLELAQQAMKRFQRIRAERVSAAGPGAAGAMDPADRQARKLNDEIGASYRALAQARQSPSGAGGRGAEASGLREAGAPRASERPAASRTSLPADRPVQVEIRQGGGGR